MREIIFRGKRVNNGEFVDGHLYGIWDKKYILWGQTNHVPNGEEVIPETVGQYTGLKDKNGKMIFEGDVVRIEDFVNATVKWREDIACWTLQSYIIGNTWGSSMLEVIGNIHEEEKK